MRIGLTYDLRSDYLAEGYSEEETAEFDRPDTIDAIESALRSLGHETDRIGHARRLVERLAAGDRWDLVFNIAEGLRGFGREAQVPALLDLYGVPYTFSDPLVLALTLHKGMTNHVVRDLGLPVAPFAVVADEADLAALETQESHAEAAEGAEDAEKKEIGFDARDPEPETRNTEAALGTEESHAEAAQRAEDAEKKETGFEVRNPKSEIRNLEPETRNTEAALGTEESHAEAAEGAEDAEKKEIGFEARDPEPGTRNLEPGTRNLKPGTRNRFPLFVKPVAEGTGKGITAASKVSNPQELASACAAIWARFGQPALIETFLPGRELTVGILGTGPDAEAIGALEVTLLENAEAGVYSYQNKELCEELVRYTLAEDALADEAMALALAVWRGLGCRDGGRVDLRAGADGRLRFLEVNPLAGLHPRHSDLPILCSQRGIPYVELIGRIVRSALQRAEPQEARR